MPDCAKAGRLYPGLYLTGLPACSLTEVRISLPGTLLPADPPLMLSHYKEQYVLHLAIFVLFSKANHQSIQPRKKTGHYLRDWDPGRGTADREVSCCMGYGAGPRDRCRS